MALKPQFIHNLELASGTAAITNELYSDARTYGTQAKSNPDKVRKIGNLIAAAAKAKGVDAFKKVIDKYAEKDHTFKSLKFMERQDRIFNSWIAVVQTDKPDITFENVFKYAVVKDHMLKFLPTMVCFSLFQAFFIFNFHIKVEIMKPQKGHAVLRSSTLVQVFNTFVSLIIQFTFDDASNKKGFELLAKEGYFTKLQNQLHTSWSFIFILFGLF
jgi:hypothetical protein